MGTLEYITRHVASLKQRYTQSSGRRPFGISCPITGFDHGGTSRLYQTDPCGTYHEWKANAIGRNAKTVREFLEKNYAVDKVSSETDTVKLAIKALLEVVEKSQECWTCRKSRKLSQRSKRRRRRRQLKRRKKNQKRNKRLINSLLLVM